MHRLHIFQTAKIGSIVVIQKTPQDIDTIKQQRYNCIKVTDKQKKIRRIMAKIIDNARKHFG